MTASTLSVRVARKVAETADISTFELVEADGNTLPDFTAGSHIDVHLPSGLTRQYSLCNSATERHRYLIGVLRDPASRGGSTAMHEVVQPGQLLKISAPKNHFPLIEDATRSLLLAGGIGVTPILCMAERLAQIGADFVMHYCARSRDRMAFHQHISRTEFSSNVHFHFDDEEPDQKLDLAVLLNAPQDGLHLYVCGPRGFMDAVLETARAHGWPERQLHYEFFSADVGTSGDNACFEVRLASSGQVVMVPKGKTVVQALAQAGVEILTSCEQGVCGTCLTRVLEGVPDHRDLYLTPEEQAANDQFTPCCSRSKSPVLTLDL
ncbi:MAG: PDR/VanB family oxidoreductase [Rhodanobacter sp.]